MVILLLIIGVLVAIPTSMVGLAGGVIFTPILLLFFDLSPNNAVAISLVAMLGNTASCSTSYLIQKRVNIKVAIVYDLADLPGVSLGAWLTIILPYDIMVGIIGISLYSMGIVLLKEVFQNNESEQSEKINLKYDFKNKHIPLALISSFFSGLVTGLVGIGGGTADTTTMLLLGMSPHLAGPTSEFAMTFTNIIGVISHAMLGNILWDVAIPLALGAVLGGQIGAYYSKKVKPKILITILVMFAWISATRLLIELFYIPPMFL